MSKLNLSKDEIYNWYIIEERNQNWIANKVGCSRQTLTRWMNYFGIPIRKSKDGLLLHYKQNPREHGPNWKGGTWTIKSTGIDYIYYPKNPRAKKENKSVPKYLLVAERLIGRFVKKNEVVHHLDSDRTNNSPDNLCVVDRGDHMRIHRALGGAGSILLKEGRIMEIIEIATSKRTKDVLRKIYIDRVKLIELEIKND